MTAWASRPKSIENKVKIAEADADAAKVQEVKQAEGQGAVRVLQAKVRPMPCRTRSR